MIIGSYYLTMEREGKREEGKIFTGPEEVVMAYQTGEVGLHARVKMHVSKEIEAKRFPDSLMLHPAV